MLAAIGFEDICRKHRGQRYCRHGRHADHDRDDPSQLAEQDTGHTRDHGQRQEHRNNHQRSGDDRQPHLIGTVDCRLAGARTAFDMCRDVFEHHDGVVHHHTDCDRKRRERDDVQCRARSEQVYECRHQRYRDGQADDECRPPTSQERHHYDDHEYEGQQHGFGQRVDTVLNLIGTVHDLLDLDVGRKRSLNLGHTFLELLDDIHGIGTRLLLDHDHGTKTTVRTGIHRRLLEGILHLGNLAQQDVAVILARNHKSLQHVAVRKLSVGLDVQRIVADIHRSARNVHVLGRNDVADGFNRKSVGLDLLGIDVYLYLANRLSHKAHRTYTVDTVQDVDQFFVEDLVQRRIAVICRHRKHHNRDHRAAELENRRIVRIIGQQGLRTAHHVSDIVGSLIQVGAPLHLQGNRRDVVRRLRSHLLEVLDRIQVILQNSGYVGLDIGRIRTGIGRDDADGRNIHLGILVDRQVPQRKESEDDDAEEDQTGRDRFSY